MPTDQSPEPKETRSITQLVVAASSVHLPLGTLHAIFRVSAQERRALTETYALLVDLHLEENATRALRQVYEDIVEPIGPGEASDIASLALYCTLLPNDAGERALCAAHAAPLLRALRSNETVDSFRTWLEQAWSIWDLSGTDGE